MKKSDVVFVDIDTQNDFLDYNGSLYIPGSENIRPNLKLLIDFAVNNNLKIISTMDSHAEDDPEFLEFKPHCIPGSWGWQKIPETIYDNYQLIEPVVEDELRLLSNRFIVKKHMIDAFSNPNLMRLLYYLEKRNFIVFGVATEYCIRQLVLKLLKEHFLVQLVEDAIIGISDENAEIAIQEMVANGAKLIKTEEVLRKIE